jgi:acyl-coenzyme A synthetase/AMP-(fatty) acid ligase
VPGVRKGCVAAFAAADPGHGTERVVVVAETRETRPAELARLRAEVVHALAHIGHPPDEVRFVAPNVIPKTPSGKVRRRACRALYMENKLDAKRPAPWRQFASVALRTLWARWSGHRG